MSILIALGAAGCGSTDGPSASLDAAANAGSVVNVAVTVGTGIGKVKLGQTPREVTALLGDGTRRGRDVRDYQESGVLLHVTYAQGHVNGIDAGSGEVRLRGKPLSKGFAYFKKGTKWSSVHCDHEYLLFHWTKRTHGETTIDWTAGGAVSDISIQDVSTPVVGGGCGAP